MGSFGRGITRRLVLAAALVVATFAFAATSASATTQTLTIGAGAQRSCATSRPITGTGVTQTRWTAARDSSMEARLAGGRGDDWDLALFDAKTGRRIDASLNFGADEVVQTLARRGQTLVIQACRLSGSSARVPLTISTVGVKLAKPGTKAPAQKLVNVGISSPLDVAVLNRLGINLNEAPAHHKVAAVLDGPADAARLARAGYKYRTLVPNLARQQRRYMAADAHAAAAGKSVLPSGRNTYRHLADIQADLKRIVKHHPKLARPITLPHKTFQGRRVTGIEVSANVHRRDDGKPAFFLMGVHHAREWPSGEIPVEYGLMITSRYGHDKRITKLLNRVRIFIVPVINPDGYTASREAVDPADTSGDPAMAPSLAESVAPPGGSLAYRRKNCHGASPNPATPCHLQYGVDPNRNYGQSWGGPGAGTNPGDQDYRGSDMWSERETQNVHEFSQDHDVTTLITMHNFASLVLRPPGVHDQGLAPDEQALKRLGDAMGRDTGYTSEYSYQLYDTSGTAEDWNYAAAGTFGYTIEMGPSSDKGGNFHVSYQRGVINQWTGSETISGKGKGLRDALLRAGAEAASRRQFSTLAGTAPPGSVLRLHKNFRTYSAKKICTVETTDVDCTAAGATLKQRSRADHLDYTTRVRSNGTFNWIVTPSTRPFVLKDGKHEKWTLTCESPVSGKVQERRRIELDRGQKLVLDLGCGGRPLGITGSRPCVDHRKFRFQIHKPHKGHITRVDVYLNGKRILSRHGKKARRKYITLNRLRKRHGHYRLTFVVYTSDGKQHISTRTYSKCRKSRPRGYVRG
jgi:murein tripeptide amidase MpaA